ncbi:MAG: hypothetical protein JEZ09_14355 [Salinivirgaceae bacterium]|nr:hypothetical protein [Salinivirgaceae bacterium]
MSYRKTYDQLANLKPVPRGNAFEDLINKIFEDKGILLKSHYRTKDGQQEIDSAILIYNKIFLIEVKWENEDTLAASKLYSFLGKINSKIEGTLGIFISYNELKQNFINSVRNGIRQNCILIHGQQNIEDIIDEKVDIEDFIEYCFIQASTRNVVEISTSEFILLPIIKSKKKASQQTNAKTKNWLTIYNSLVGKDSVQNFSANIAAYYTSDLELSKKLLDIYNTLQFDIPTKVKFNKLIEKLIAEEKDEFTSILSQKLKGNDWLSYADEHFCILLQKYELDFHNDDRKLIIENVTSVLGNSSWESENKATYVIDIFYAKLTKTEKESLLIKFLEIYCDKTRMEKFPQKQFAQKLYSEHKNKDYLPIIKTELIDDLKAIKILEEMHLKEGFKQLELKDETLTTFARKYHKIFEDNSHDIKAFFEEEYKKL